MLTAISDFLCKIIRHSILLTNFMKLILIFILFCVSNFTFGQTNWRDTTNGIPLNFSDTCNKIDKGAYLNLVTKSRHPQPLYVANGIVIRGDILNIDTSLIKSISVLKCPDSFNEFGYIGYNGTILITTKQEIDTVTPNSIKESKFKKITGDIIYALNGDFITDSNLKISTTSIKEIELLKAGTEKGNNINFRKFTCINIWTLTKDERKPTSVLCRGLRITQQ